MSEKESLVVFVDKKTESKFESLQNSDDFERKLHIFIEQAINDLKKDSSCGVKIPKSLWPKEYKQKYSITNLWKYNLPNAWRLIYTVQSDEVMILNIILEWFSHKNYERRFKY
ncbi:MAG: hypothetical protein ACQESC_03900 [Nanobdellota archaeon]